MASASSYWMGEALIRLSAQTITASRLRNQASIKFSNQVFSTWRHDSKAVRATGAKKAQRTLEDMGHTRGFFAAINPMISVKTMWDACTHYAGNKQKWTDDNYSHYGSGHFGGMVSDVPWCLATFAKAYDSNVNDLIALIKKQQSAVKGLKRAIENKPRVEWKTINDPLKQFDEYTKAIEPLMVTCPESKGLQSWNYAKTLGKYTGAADDLMAEVRKSGDVTTSAAVTALAFIVGECVPVFGSLYAEAIKGVPNAIRYFEDIKYERNHMMAKVYGSSFKMYGP